MPHPKCLQSRTYLLHCVRKWDQKTIKINKVRDRKKVEGKKSEMKENKKKKNPWAQVNYTEAHSKIRMGNHNAGYALQILFP